MEKVYQSMKSAGIFNLVMGILVIVAGAIVGSFAIVHGALLLRRKNEITF
ncbi:hypothetical protein [Hominifimenecus sp. rT4P-3]